MREFLATTNKLELPENWSLRSAGTFRQEYQGAPLNYVFLVMQGELDLAEIHVNEKGEIYKKIKYEMDQLK